MTNSSWSSRYLGCEVAEELLTWRQGGGGWFFFAVTCGFLRALSVWTLSPSGADTGSHHGHRNSINLSQKQQSQEQQQTNNSNLIRGRREEPPSLVGGPTQLQLSRSMSTGHHISMEHRLKRKRLQFNCDTDASNERCSKGKEQKQQKRKRKHKKKRRKTH